MVRRVQLEHPRTPHFVHGGTVEFVCVRRSGFYPANIRPTGFYCSDPRDDTGRIVSLKNGKYVPQLKSLKGYGAYDVKTNGLWLCWTYMEMGFAPDHGERIYAYNLNTGREYLVWKAPANSVEQLFEVDLANQSLYIGVQGVKGQQVYTRIDAHNLSTQKTTTFLQTQASGNPVTVRQADSLSTCPRENPLH